MRGVGRLMVATSNGMLTVGHFYWDHRRAIWHQLSEYVDSLRHPDRCEIRLSPSENHQYARCDGDSWKIELPDCCAVCGAGHSTEARNEGLVAYDLSAPLWGAIIGASVGFTLTLFFWNKWLLPVSLVTALLAGFRYRKESIVQVRYYLCQDHATSLRFPAIRCFQKLLIVEVGSHDVVRQFARSVAGLRTVSAPDGLTVRSPRSLAQRQVDSVRASLRTDQMRAPRHGWVDDRLLSGDKCDTCGGSVQPDLKNCPRCGTPYATWVEPLPQCETQCASELDAERTTNGADVHRSGARGVEQTADEQSRTFVLAPVDEPPKAVQRAVTNRIEDVQGGRPAIRTDGETVATPCSVDDDALRKRFRRWEIVRRGLRLTYYRLAIYFTICALLIGGGLSSAVIAYGLAGGSAGLPILLICGLFAIVALIGKYLVSAQHARLVGVYVASALVPIIVTVAAISERLWPPLSAIETRAIRDELMGLLSGQQHFLEICAAGMFVAVCLVVIGIALCLAAPSTFGARRRIISSVAWMLTTGLLYLTFIRSQPVVNSGPMHMMALATLLAFGISSITFVLFLQAIARTFADDRLMTNERNLLIWMLTGGFVP